LVIAHLASPISFDFTNPEPLIRTAVDGTTGVLDSALTSPSVKSVVVMSSAVATSGDTDTPTQTWTEADWNTPALDAVAQLGPKTPGRVAYFASKAVRATGQGWIDPEESVLATVTAFEGLL
jgi:nucleoside-diphosphate-sugar epimerase